jgi:GTPase SAR1 family protein
VVPVDREFIRLEIQDMPGQEKFKAISRAYCRNVVDVGFAFVLTDLNPFDAMSKWLEDCRATASRKSTSSSSQRERRIR